ncbi:MAG: hypothetical protein AABX64_00875 [Nanoarchaeota archaeon]
MLEKITENLIFIAPLAAALYSSPVSAQISIKTEEDLTKAMIETNTVYFISHPNDQRKKDWEKYLELIGADEEVVVKQTDGKTYFGLDGWGQVLEPKHQQRSTENGVLDLSERIPNYTIPKFSIEKPEDRHYAFLGLPELQQEPKQADPFEETYTVPVAIVPVPGPVIEKEVSAGEISIGAGYLQIYAASDEKYGFNGQLYGGKAWLTFQPRETNWYFGPEIMAYGNSASAAQNVEIPAKDGPLAGELTLEGTNEYSLSVFGLGTGFISGYMVAEKNNFGLGLELHSGIMLDLMARELTEKSAYYINGNLVEGTSISNTSADDETAVNMYTELGAKIKLSALCFGPAVGMRTDAGRVDPLYSMSIGYCPNRQE